MSRTVQNTSPSGTYHLVYDLAGNVIAEANASGDTLREYVWLDGRPIAVIGDVDTTPVIYQVHTDHLDRPYMMTDENKDTVWQATYLPFGEVFLLTGSETLDYRFPGQWFQLETGLSYNWHRHYDPSTGRYLQPDPLGLEAGIARWSYALNSPQMYVDPDGRFWNLLLPAARAFVSRVVAPVMRGLGQLASRAPRISGTFGGIALDVTANQLRNSNCGCGPRNSTAGQIARGAVAGASGFVVADSMTHISYPRGSVRGSIGQTSGVSRFLSGGTLRFRIPTLTNYGTNVRWTNNFGRAVGRWLPWAGVGYLAYDAGRLVACWNNINTSR
ncbi:MAG: hypothetical protein IT534_11850 [Bauldia sp.]|nr:hypothetical protein [Bauldia sp.]